MGVLVITSETTGREIEIITAIIGVTEFLSAKMARVYSPLVKLVLFVRLKPASVWFERRYIAVAVSSEKSVEFM